MKNKLVTLLFLIGSLSLSSPGAATALPSEGEQGPVDCTFQVTMRFAFPPLPGAKVQSEAGQFDCSGQMVNGQTVIGRAAYAMEGTYTSGCAGGFSNGMGTVTSPRSSGRSSR